MVTHEEVMRGQRLQDLGEDWTVRRIETYPLVSFRAEHCGGSWAVTDRGSGEFEAEVNSGLTLNVGGHDYPLKFYGFGPTPQDALAGAKKDLSYAINKLASKLCTKF